MNFHCLNCHSEIDYHITWNSFFFTPKELWLCGKCSSQLHPIAGERCQICSRQLSLLEPQYIKEGICLDCIRWEQDPIHTSVLTQNISIYNYNDFLKEYLARFKYRGDYVLVKAFTQAVQQEIHNLEADLITTIPLSSERLQERGFNQAEALAKESGLTTQQLLVRRHSEKQSKKSRQQRIASEEVFQLPPDLTPDITHKSILIIDDIYTTGTTLRQAAKLLKQAGAGKISSLTIARG
ncbi:ComF family protein [Bacillus salacetis]|uniref:ComF family protein n=1 Tax=Bacillus salacetis TaxID=2315464 RepID=A0A3A1R770_9BACI|nr:ComF family protein [Bacillus salacetis]RIW39068.1 ComF family protein [Bacillus salacetis]